MATKAEMLGKALRDLNRAGDIEASVVISRDGLLMMSDFVQRSYGAETFAAMSATMLGAAKTTTPELKKGIPDRVIVETRGGKLITLCAGPKALLVVMTSPEVGLGLILVEMEKTADKIRGLL